MASPLKGTAEGAPLYTGAGNANLGENQAGNQADLLGEGTAAAPAAPAAPPPDQLGADAFAHANNRLVSDRLANTNLAGQPGQTLPDGAHASSSNWDATFDRFAKPDPSTVGSMKDLFNNEGNNVGVSHVGDVIDPGGFNVQNPFTWNPVAGAMNPDTGLGTTATGGDPVTNLSPGTREAAGVGSQGILPTTAAGVGDALDAAMGGGGNLNVDTSGSDRGGMGLNGAYSPQLSGAAAQSSDMQAQGAGVLNGTTAPGGAGAPAQQDALDAAMNFQTGPRQASGVVGDVNNFMQAPQGPSAAELQLKQGAQGNMSDALALARSGRARDAGSLARNLNVAQAQNAATGVDTARDTAALRAKETTDAKAQQLQALGLKGNLAQGLDQGTLSALGLQGDLSNQMRNANVTERGQSLGFDQAQNATGAGLTSDVLKAIPQLETIRHTDQFDLTPQQKIAAAKIGAVPGKTTADYVTALLGDTLSAL